MKINFRYFLITLALATLLLIGVCHAEDASFYVISYDGNGGDCFIDDQAKYPGVDLKLSTSTSTYRGFIFLGWDTDPNATTVKYNPGDMYTADASATLYAVWMPCEDLGTITNKGNWTISYPVTGRMAYVHFQVAEDGKYLVRSTNETYQNSSGNTRVEWYESETDFPRWFHHSVNSLRTGFEAVVELEAGVDYYLQYVHSSDPLLLEISDEVYSVSYDGNDADCFINDQVKYPGTDLKLSTSTPSNRGFFFLGWNTEPNATTVEYYPGDTYSANASTTLYAVWMPCEDLGTITNKGNWTISYPATGRVAYVHFQVAEDGKYLVRSTNETYQNSSGNTRVEWYESEAYFPGWFHHSVTSLKNGFEAVVELEAGIDYYLKYVHSSDPLLLEISNEVYSVSYDGNGGDCFIDDQVKYSDVDLKLSTSTPSTRGFFFLGWNTDPDATTVEYYPGDTYSANASATLYAVWMPCEDLGTVEKKGLWTISYPTTGRVAYVHFQVVRDDHYVIRSANDFYQNSSGGTRVEWYESEADFPGWFHHSVNRLSNGFEAVVELEAGVDYYLEYYHYSDPLLLEIIPQYPERQDVYLLLPEDLDTVEQEAFAGTTIVEVEIPANVKSIESRAFANCSKLINVIVHSPDVVIADDAFQGCSGLKFLAPAGSTAQTFAKEHNFLFFVPDE